MLTSSAIEGKTLLVRKSCSRL